jgi:hypothetical protein
MSLDLDTLAMVGVGASGGCRIAALPPLQCDVEAAVQAYRVKVAAMKRCSPEERYVIARIRAALSAELELGDGLLFLHQEWRFTTSDKIDVLAVDARSGQLVVVEAKQSEAKALAPLTFEQATGYVALLTSSWSEYLPYLQRLATALARIYRPHVPAPSIDASLRPRWEVWWPGGHRRASSMPANRLDARVCRIE